MTETDVQRAAGTEVSFLIPDTESLGKLKGYDTQFSLTLKYKSSDDWAGLKDRPLRAYYMGLKEIPNEDGELITCAVFVSERECFISGQMVLVEAVRNLAAKTPVEVTYRGKRNNKSSDGSTMLFDVEKLG